MVGWLVGWGGGKGRGREDIEEEEGGRRMTTTMAQQISPGEEGEPLKNDERDWMSF